MDYGYSNAEATLTDSTMFGANAARKWRRCGMPITVQWSHIGVGAVIAFLIGWLIFGLLGAVILAIIVLVLMGVIRIT